MIEKLIVITGPTGAGKTELSVKVALWLENAEIISADSRHIYKEMSVGTDKIKQEEMKGVPHHLINIKNPDEAFTVAEYKKKARRKIKEIQSGDNIPILCGGSYFYIKAVIDGLILPQVPPDWNYRKKKRKESTEELYEELKEKDPRRAKNIDRQNKRRLIRALEIIKKTGKPVPKLKKDPLPYPILILGVKRKEEELQRKIERRIDEMMEKRGLEKEAGNLLKKYGKVPRETIGYKEWEPFFKGEKKKSQVIEYIKTHTKQFSKKQKNWFKKDERIIWIKNLSEAKKKISTYLKSG